MRLPRRAARSDDPTSRRRRSVVLLATALVAAVAGTATYAVLGGDEAPEQAAPIYSTGSTFITLSEDILDSLDAADRQAPKTPRGDGSDVEPGSPRRLVIPTLGVDSAIVPITAPGGTLTPPSDAQQVGWWSAGAEPGAEVGSALVTGHTLSRGGGALQDLETLEAGDTMAVRTADGVIDYRVTDVEIFSKGTVAEEAGELFSQSTPGRLVVITCEDYDGFSYQSNVVVTATPVGRSTADF